MDKIIKKILAILGFINRVNPMVIDSVDTATKKLDKIIGKTVENLEAVESSKEVVKERIDEAIMALSAEWEAAEEQADKATEKLAKLRETGLV